MTEQDKAWDALVKMARDSIEDSKKDVYNGLLSCAPEEAILAADAELTSLRARIEVLEKAIEWAIQYLERDVFNVDEVNGLIQWMIDELRRRAKVSP